MRSPPLHELALDAGVDLARQPVAGDERRRHEIEAMLDSDPERAGRIVLEQGQIQPLLQSWSYKDPAAAVGWIDANLEDSDHHAALLGMALPEWVKADEPAALRFLERMELGPAYDQAAYRSMEVLVHDRAAAEHLYEKINDPRWRTEAAKRLREMPP